MRRLVDLAAGSGAPLHAAFVDFSKAFDRVNREVLWEVLLARGVHPKLVELVKDLYTGCQARVAAHGTTSDWFELRTGVRQGCPLSPLLFNVFMDFLARQVMARCRAQGVNGFTIAFRFRDGSRAYANSEQLLHTLMLLYADDMVLLAHDRRGLEIALRELEAVTNMWGMRINYDKTQALLIHHQETEVQRHYRSADQVAAVAAATADIQLQHGTVKYVEYYKYLGGTIHDSGSVDMELSKRLGAAAGVFGSLRRAVFAHNAISLDTKVKVYNSVVLPVLLYRAAESWPQLNDEQRNGGRWKHSTPAACAPSLDSAVRALTP